MTQCDRPSFYEMRLQVALADAVTREAKVKWSRPGDVNPSAGRIRHGVWTEELQLTSADPRDGCIRITSRSGAELTMRWQEAIALMAAACLYLD